ncbi:hypothetical protein [Adlercreutzia wanghongyangiae]
MGKETQRSCQEEQKSITELVFFPLAAGQNAEHGEFVKSEKLRATRRFR